MKMKWTNSIASRVKMRDLQIVLAVANARGIGKAATELAISQPAVSKAISGLEAEFGVPFFDRTANGVQVTPYGDAILESARAIFDSLRQGVTAIDFLADPTVGQVRIGTTPPLAAGFVPSLVAHIAARFPRLEYHLIQGDVGLLLRHLRERALDLAIAPNLEMSGEEGLDLKTLFDDRHVPVAAARSRWARRRTIAWDDVTSEPWVLPPPDIALWPDLVEAFRRIGVAPPRAIIATVSIPAHLRLVATGQFLTLLPLSVLQFAAKTASLKRLRLDLPVTARPVVVATLKNRTLSPAVKTFIDGACRFAVGAKK